MTVNLFGSQAVDEAKITLIVDEVVRKLSERGIGRGSGNAVRKPGGADTGTAEGGASPTGLRGVYRSMDEACQAAWRAQQTYGEASLETRRKVVQTIRETAHAHKEEFARVELEETRLGRLDHKVAKLEVCADLTPGVEDLTTRCWSGDHGLTVEEYAPYGVIAAVTPVTHAIPTMINNAISILAGGNTVVFNPHPSSKKCFAWALDIFNSALAKATGHENLMTCIDNPTIETGKEMFNHPRVRVILVTGGGAVVREALKSQKKAITAGPGNPPVVVDETAILPRAARDIVLGAGFDNNILCIGEKEVFVVASVADRLMAEFRKLGCVELTPPQIDALARKAFQTDGDVTNARSCGGAALNRAMVGQSAHFLAKQIGLEVPADCPMLIGETGFDHMWVQTEQMMPFLPIVRCRDVDEAIEFACQAEHGYGHTAVIHSMNVANMTKMGRLMNVSIFVKNGPSYAGLGIGGEGQTSFSIASPTGEGITTARTFCRLRRCSMVDYLRVV